MKTTAQLTFENVRFDDAKDVHLVVSLASPHGNALATRQPVCVIPVLDVSGSMEGPKLHYAKQSILKLVDHLAPGDFCGVVVFSTEVETLAAPAEMTQERKDALKAAIGRLGARRNTNLGGGLLAGLDHAKVTRLPEGMLVRVILFTDGHANEGPAKTPAELRRLLEANLGAATVSAFGYGDDVDHELLRELATLGRGNYASVRSPEDALTAFARELGGLLSTYAQAIEVRVTPREGGALTDVVSDVDAREEAGSAVIRVPDLLADEVRHLVLAARLAPRPVPLDAPVAVADVEVAFERLEDGRLVKERRACKATARFVAAADAQAAPAPDVDAIVAVAQLVRAQIEAEEAARQGRYGEAREVMVLFQHAIADRGHGAVAAAAGKLAGKVGTRDAYEASAAYRSGMRRGSTRDVSSLYDAAADADLRSMGRAGKTAAQDRMEEAFGAPLKMKREGAKRGGIARRRSGRW
ncbi:vWA domain-containing protein [Anaeromyxobacter oryzisoli]|uniref:vWA domain-containing protein n=1 Tax=Anaeromyxobacter oryzisoli TaxID=2925408 RepID=UPI001F5AF267|nr:VWA domain-containing protein [Anaeromyxobacter sp. SG63]